MLDEEEILERIKDVALSMSSIKEASHFVRTVSLRDRLTSQIINR